MVDRGLSRLILMITSQWPAGGPGLHLDFIPSVDWQPGQSLSSTARLPVNLYEQFLDPDAGACDAVPGMTTVPGIALYESASSLVINPTRIVAQEVLKHAFAQASELQRVLVVHFIGHGLEDRPADNMALAHRLLLMDSTEMPQTDLDAWNPYAEAGQHLTSQQPPGFMLLVDACQASRARPEITPWGETSSTYVWMGASQDTAAFDGCFSNTLLAVMRDGDPTRSGPRPTPELHSRHLRPLIDQRCNRPAERKLPEADDITSKADDYVYITRNRAVGNYEADLGLAGATRDRLRSAIGEHYQVIDIAGVSEAIESDPFVVLTGGAGSGKTSLAAVLRDPPYDLDFRRVDAVTFLETASDLDLIASALYPQLATNRRYADLQNRFERSVEEPHKLGAHERYLSGPLGSLSGLDSFIVCLDGLDQLNTDRQTPVLDEYRRLITASGGRFRVLATSRPESAGGPVPAGATTIAMPNLDETLARRYLAARGVTDVTHQDRILSLDGGDPNWLVLTLAADQVGAGGSGVVSDDIGELYRHVVASATEAFGTEAVHATIDVLAASGEVAGVGPRLPFAIFSHAVAKLGGPTELRNVNSVLGHERLYRIIERANPATNQEHLGLFHLTAIEALRPPQDRRQAAHSAITEVLDELLESEDE